MRDLLLLGAALLAACTTTPPPPPPAPAHPAFDVAEARTTVERDVEAGLGATVLEEARRATTAILTRQGVHHPRMIQQPDGTWKPEGPYVNAAVRTSQGWVGWTGGARAALAPETGRELDRLLASPDLWREPAFPEPGCVDWSGATAVIRHQGRERVATQVCGPVALTGQLTSIVQAGRVTDQGHVPTGRQPAGLPLARFDEPLSQSFRYASALREPANIVVRTQPEWEALWRRITARQGPPPAVPAVNFERDMLLVAAMGARPSGGYSIRIERVIDGGDRLEAHVVRTSPGSRCGAIAAITHPVDVVRIAASHKQVSWTMRDAVTDCP